MLSAGLRRQCQGTSSLQTLLQCSPAVARPLVCASGRLLDRFSPLLCIGGRLPILECKGCHRERKYRLQYMRYQDLNHTIYLPGPRALADLVRYTVSLPLCLGPATAGEGHFCLLEGRSLSAL